MSTEINFKQPFADNVDEKATLKLMKKHLVFLSKNAYLLEETAEDQYVEDDDAILNYLNYTKSVINLQENASSPSQSTKLIQAIGKKDEYEVRRRNLRTERKVRCGWLIQGISKLKEVEKKILVYRYVQDMDITSIQSQYNNLSTSSLYRIQNRACLHLASILDIEIYKEGKEETLFSCKI